MVSLRLESTFSISGSHAKDSMHKVRILARLIHQISRFAARMCFGHLNLRFGYRSDRPTSLYQVRNHFVVGWNVLGRAPRTKHSYEYSSSS